MLSRMCLMLLHVVEYFTLPRCVRLSLLSYNNIVMRIYGDENTQMK